MSNSEFDGPVQQAGRGRHWRWLIRAVCLLLVLRVPSSWAQEGDGIGKKDPVDTATLFKIASNSKAFTTAALATLVDGDFDFEDLNFTRVEE